MTVHEVLVATKNLIPTEADWCGRGWGADGKRCLVHALVAASGIAAEAFPQAIVFAPAYKLLTQLGGMSPWMFNDRNSFAEVHRLLDDAIAITAPVPDLSVLEEHTAVVA